MHFVLHWDKSKAFQTSKGKSQGLYLKYKSLNFAILVLTSISLSSHSLSFFCSKVQKELWNPKNIQMLSELTHILEVAYFEDNICN